MNSSAFTRRLQATGEGRSERCGTWQLHSGCSAFVLPLCRYAALHSHGCECATLRLPRSEGPRRRYPALRGRPLNAAGADRCARTAGKPRMRAPPRRAGKLQCGGGASLHRQSSPHGETGRYALPCRGRVALLARFPGERSLWSPCRSLHGQWSRCRCRAAARRLCCALAARPALPEGYAIAVGIELARIATIAHHPQPHRSTIRQRRKHKPPEVAHLSRWVGACPRASSQGRVS
jgi:hypothetical protein